MAKKSKCFPLFTSFVFYFVFLFVLTLTPVHIVENIQQYWDTQIQNFYYHFRFLICNELKMFQQLKIDNIIYKQKKKFTHFEFIIT